MGTAVDIAIRHNAWTSVGCLDRLIERAVEMTFDEIGVIVSDETEVCVLLCDDAFMRTLNRDWRGKDQPTNILSFPSDPSARLFSFGDIAVAFETSAREACDEGKDIGDHLSHLIVHGVLHLLGYDHETDAEAEIMERLEVRVLTRLGIASPYKENAPLRAPA